MTLLGSLLKADRDDPCSRTIQTGGRRRSLGQDELLDFLLITVQRFTSCLVMVHG